MRLKKQSNAKSHQYRESLRSCPAMQKMKRKIEETTRSSLIQMQFDGALGELETLKQQNAEKMGQLSQEAEYFRNMYKKSVTTNSQTQEELRTVKALNVDLLAAKQQLLEDLEQVN